ncbi:MAG: hypothetical protein O2890_14775, partial [Cyanobacteria bacterium]|nr:hypothetical protein [Cyanobacteriota bacterium]MDA0867634.1 hypothetical protein [Cyanobacteriota bacterium]
MGKSVGWGRSAAGTSAPTKPALFLVGNALFLLNVQFCLPTALFLGVSMVDGQLPGLFHSKEMLEGFQPKFAAPLGL